MSKITAGTPVGSSTPNVLAPTPAAGANAATPLAQQFHNSPLHWARHFLGGTAQTPPTETTATTTTTSTTVTSSTSTTTATTTATLSNTSNSSSKQAIPQWQRDLPDGFLRGDECFLARYGDGGALLDVRGHVVEGFSFNPQRCHPALKPHAQLLAVTMKIRNEAVAILLDAQEALYEAEAALEQAKSRGALKKGLVHPEDRRQGKATIAGREKLLAVLTSARDDAKATCAKLSLALDQTQQALVLLHANAQESTSKSDKDLDFNPNLAHCTEPLLMHSSFAATSNHVYLLLGLAGGLAGQALEPLQSLIETLGHDIGEPAEMLFGAILEAAGVSHERAVAASHTSGVSMLLGTVYSGDVVFGIVLGVVFAHMLLRLKII